MQDVDQRMPHLVVKDRQDRILRHVQRGILFGYAVAVRHLRVIAPLGRLDLIRHDRGLRHPFGQDRSGKRQGESGENGKKHSTVRGDPRDLPANRHRCHCQDG